MWNEIARELYSRAGARSQTARIPDEVLETLAREDAESLFESVVYSALRTGPGILDPKKLGPRVRRFVAEYHPKTRSILTGELQRELKAISVSVSYFQKLLEALSALHRKTLEVEENMVTTVSCTLSPEGVMDVALLYEDGSYTTFALDSNGKEPQEEPEYEDP